MATVAVFVKIFMVSRGRSISPLATGICRLTEPILLETRRADSPSESLGVKVTSTTSISTLGFPGLCVLLMEGTAPYKGCQVKVKQPEGQWPELAGSHL